LPFIFKQYNEDWAYDLSKDFISKGEVFNSDVINQSIHLIVTTIPGERLFNRTFGSPLYINLFENLTESKANSILTDVINSIKRWEDRISVDEPNCKMNIYTDEHTLELIIPYVILKTRETNQYQQKFFS